MRLIRLDSKNQECWSHLSLVRESIAAAGVHFKQKGCSAVLDRIVANFAAESLDGYHLLPKDQQHAQNAAVWYIWDDSSGGLRGHLVALQGEWDGDVVLYIYQLWATRTKSSIARDAEFEALQDTAREELDHYARSRGAARVLMYTVRPARFWTKRFAFRMHRFMYEHPVTP